ncbi:ras-related protein Rap-2c-like [Mercenaria mercenaria]|uniref:ras-related protein Rap-2c-like n=1 Tax=Mercenaria mercenaria TaxID=6596 RepID=UPI00234F0CE1|nr:ras-related protein Rap-2c-like [Mercenaria mercenaria]XP_045211663.2 ras-related protein Rap-2c-like [Mercenaria mercenaria]XP_045211664.2 ras-related protein Rap-2c-like [Mercenaria mercenaria]XP_045211665.2 ras-related protein Rap-2c-like [Mercenaria mercenaria]XP_045211666.2 ras-related protein Rap-2c-like [Mercenaria mercenaria]XP_053385189.1 ras-related protein Rap-2c-like [Mercenaria mercenaria]
MPLPRETVSQNYRVVFMGTSGVGKSSIINQFINNKFTEIHKETVEELHRHSMKFETVSVDIDILDTSGSYQFPAMRKLAIATGDAFVLVYSVTNAESFETVKSLREEIKEHTHDRKYSIVVVANKTDLGDVTGEHAVNESVVCMDWEEKFVTTSAKTGENIDTVFRLLENKIKETVQMEDKRRSFFRRISMPVLRLAKSNRRNTQSVKIKPRSNSVDL